jgi:hypothetical protein
MSVIVLLYETVINLLCVMFYKLALNTICGFLSILMVTRFRQQNRKTLTFNFSHVRLILRSKSSPGMI